MGENRSIAKCILKDCDQDTYDRIMRRAKLTPEERELCDLRYCKGLQLYQIAIRWKCSGSRVYKMHTRILDRLSGMLKQ